MHIRRALAIDVSPVNDIVERAYSIYIERIGRRPAPMDDDYAEKIRQGHTFVADDDGIAGLIVLIHEVDHLLIENVAVDPRRQREGIGRALLSYAETHAHELRASTLRLYTNAAMTENLALYTSLGYHETHRRSENGFQRVYLSKRL